MDKKIIVISPPEVLRNEKERVEELIKAGLDYFHVRKPGYKPGDTEQYLNQYSLDVRQKMILHHHYELAEKYDLRGIHITEKNKNRGYEKVYSHRQISISCHHPEELKDLSRNYAYAFLSPVMDSLSKQDYPAAFRLEGLINFLLNNKELPPVIALGGIHPGSVSKIKGLGFSGIALLGAIWPELSNLSDTLSPLENFMQIKDLVKVL